MINEIMLRGFGTHHRLVLELCDRHWPSGVHIGKWTRDGEPGDVVAMAHTGFLQRRGLISTSPAGRGRNAYITAEGRELLEHLRATDGTLPGTGTAP